MERREFIKAGVTLIPLVLGSRLLKGEDEKTSSESEPLPNIIVIMADDLGYGDLSCYGSEAIQTPNLDKMAEEGIRFTDFFSSSPVCSPSRAGLLTGRYPPRTKITQVLFPTTGPEAIVNAYLLSIGHPLALPKDEITLADLLKKAGYKTCCIGKWHLGDIPGYRPNDRGFDHYLGLLYSNDMLPLPLYRNREIIEKSPVNQDLLTMKYTEEALWFIKQNKDRPFFIYLAHTFPHQPLHASEEFRGKSKAGLYGDCVEEIDFSVGRILSALDDYGLSENTLVMFTSDNGPWYQGSPGIYRGRKNECFDGGMRVPMIVRWKGKIPASRVTDEIGMNIDIFTTCASAAKVNLPEDRIIDGLNLLPLMQGKENKSPHSALFFYHGRELQAVRVGKWKYHPKHYVVYYPVGTKQGPFLFNQEIDPNESYNLIHNYPDVAREMEKLIEEWKKGFNRGFKKKV